MHLLVVDDQKDIAASIVDFFTLKGHVADYAHNATSMLALVESHSYDVILLDVMMPGDSGFTACVRLREELKSQVPVLFLTALDTLEDKLTGFEVGADDYVVKPFAMHELLARTLALSSRGGRRDKGAMTLLDLHIDVQMRIVERQGVAIDLNRTQFEILLLLARSYPSVLSRKTLELAVWGDEPPDSDVLKTQVYQLRKKLDKPFTSSIVQTVHGVGYQLALES